MQVLSLGPNLRWEAGEQLDLGSNSTTAARRTLRYLYTGAEANLRERVLGETEKNLLLWSKRGHSELLSWKTVCPNSGGFGEEFYSDSSRVGGEGNGTPLQSSCLENPMDGGAWWAAVCGVTKSPDMTEGLHFHFSLSCVEEGNGNPLQCSCLENPRDGEPGGLPSMGSHRFGHD